MAVIDAITLILGLSLVGLYLFGVYSGARKTFKRNPVIATTVFVLSFPFWMVWACVENFTDEPPEW